MNAYVVPLPETAGDAAIFESVAWRWAQADFWGLLGEFPGFSSYFLSWLIGILYFFFGRDIFVAQTLSVVPGVLLIAVAWSFSRRVWGCSAGVRSAWAIALFPPLILYSSIVSREPFIWLITSLSFLSLYIWARELKIRYSLIAAAGFATAALFHGGFFIGVSSVLFILMLQCTYTVAVRAYHYRLLPLRYFSTVVFAALALAILFQVDLEIPKLGTLERLSRPDEIILQLSKYAVGDAGYPVWLTAQSLGELIILAPVRFLYFFISPFPWDVSKLQHIVGLFDGLIYAFLLSLVLFNSRSILKNRGLIVVIAIALVLALAFSFGTSNFGTGMRHRAKFFLVFVVLIAPCLPYFTMSRSVHSKDVSSDKHMGIVPP